MTITANAQRDGVTLEVTPGGALRGLELTEDALRTGGPALARTILALVGEATARADQRARLAMRDAIGDLTDSEATVLGLTRDDKLTEVAEGTTPEHWRV